MNCLNFPICFLLGEEKERREGGEGMEFYIFLTSSTQLKAKLLFACVIYYVILLLAIVIFG